MDSKLQILISAIDQASATISGISGSLENMGNASLSASTEVAEALAAIGTAAVAAAGAVVTAAADQQVAEVRLNTTITDSIGAANDAAKGQGAFAAELAGAKNQAALASNELDKLKASAKSNSDQIDQAQQKYDVAAAKLEVLQGKADDAGKSAQDLSDSFQVAVDAGTNLGFTVDQTTNALNILEPIMGSKLALSTLTAAENLSRMSNGTLDLASASKLLGTAMETGVGRGLATYGIVVKDGIGGTELLQAAMQASQGQAAAYASTLSGQLAVAWAQINKDMGDAGKTVIPILTAAVEEFIKFLPVMIDDIQDAVKWSEQHKTILLIVAGAITGALIPAMVAFATALITVTIPAIVATMVALWPFIVGGAIVAGVIAGIIWLSDNWKKIWTDIKTFTKTLIDDVGQFFKNLYDTYIAPVLNAISSVGNAIGKGVGAVSSTVGSVGNAVGGALTSFGHVLGFASGGVVTGPTLGVIGEAGPEMIIPLSAINGGGALGLGLGGAGQGGNVIINLQGSFYTDAQTASKFANLIAKQIQAQLRLKRVA